MENIIFYKNELLESLVFQGFGYFWALVEQSLRGTAFFVGKKRINIMHDVFALEKKKNP
ncbi:MAG: hypothetical protein ACLVEN_06110 [Anaerotignum lactatifermentans]|uniref:hypothetical protein n=1 Tax=Anaerotignum lactatifermentans TaxID=160404 RepID=UPI00399B6600